MSTQPEERDIASLWDMRRNALLVARMVEGASFEDFGPDSMLRLAVERALEIVGEAARGASSEFRAAHPQIPWADIIGQRNILAHEYGYIDGRRLWQIRLIQDMAALIEAIDKIVPR